MKSCLLVLFLMIAEMRSLMKFRKAKGHLHLKTKEDDKDEPKIIAGFNSKAILPPISMCN